MTGVTIPRDDGGTWRLIDIDGAIPWPHELTAGIEQLLDALGAPRQQKQRQRDHEPDRGD